MAGDGEFEREIRKSRGSRARARCAEEDSLDGPSKVVALGREKDQERRERRHIEKRKGRRKGQQKAKKRAERFEGDLRMVGARSGLGKKVEKEKRRGTRAYNAKARQCYKLAFGVAGKDYPDENGNMEEKPWSKFVLQRQLMKKVALSKETKKSLRAQAAVERKLKKDIRTEKTIIVQDLFGIKATGPAPRARAPRHFEEDDLWEVKAVEAPVLVEKKVEPKEATLSSMAERIYKAQRNYGPSPIGLIRQGVAVVTDLLSRKMRLAEIRTALLQGGVEWNPGPKGKKGGKGGESQGNAARRKVISDQHKKKSVPQVVAAGVEEPSVKLKREEHQEHSLAKGKSAAKGGHKALVNILKEQVADEQAQHAAAIDVERDMEKEEREQKEAEALARHQDRCADDVHAFAAGNLDLLGAPCGMCSDGWLTRAGLDEWWYPWRVAHKREELVVMDPVPHYEVEFGYTGSTQFIDDERAPTKQSGKLPKDRPQRWLRYKVMVHHCGALVLAGQEPEALECEVYFTLESFLIARQARLADSRDLRTVSERVSVFRSSNFQVNGCHYDCRDSSEWSDMVFAALLLLDPAAPAKHLCFDMAAVTGAHLVQKAVSSFMSYEPGAAGAYVQGYPVRMDEVITGVVRAGADRAHQAVIDAGGLVSDAVEATVDAVCDRRAGFIPGGLFHPARDFGRQLKDKWKHMRMPVVFAASKAVAERIDESLKTAGGTFCSTEVLMPARGDESDKGSVAMSFTKRLGSNVPPPSNKLLRLMHLATTCLCERISAAPGRTREALHREAYDRAYAQPWTEDQRKEFMAGAGMAWRLCHEDVGDGELKSALGTYGFFIKKEVYPSEKPKALRFIVCPSHFVRGLTFSLFHDAEHQILRAMKNLSVKGMCRVDQMGKLDEVLKGVAEVCSIDLECFESTLSGDRQATVENRVYFRAVADDMKQGAKRVLDMLSGAFMRADGPDGVEMRELVEESALEVDDMVLTSDVTLLLGALGMARTRIMRRSGELKTAFGNMVQNFAGSVATAAVARFKDKAMEHVRDIVNEALDCGVGLIEGDDSVWNAQFFGGSEELVRAAAELSLPLKVDITDRDGAHFLSSWSLRATRVVRSALRGLVGARQAIRDPLDLLARAFTLFPDSPDSAKRDLDLVTAKVLSYVREYGHLPVVGPILVAFWDRYKHRILGDVVRLKQWWRQFCDEHKPDIQEFKLWLVEKQEEITDVQKELLVRVFGFREADLEAFLDADIGGFEHLQLNVEERSLLREYGHLVTGMPAEVQILVEREIQRDIMASQIEDVDHGPIVFVLPNVLLQYGLRKGVANMTMRIFPGARERATRLVEGVRARIDLEKVRAMASWLFGKAVWLSLFMVGCFAMLQFSLFVWWSGVVTTGTVMTMGVPSILLALILAILFFGGDFRMMFKTASWFVRIVIVVLVLRLVGKKIEGTQWWRNLPSPEIRRWCHEAGYEWPAARL